MTKKLTLIVHCMEDYIETNLLFGNLLNPSSKGILKEKNED